MDENVQEIWTQPLVWGGISVWSQTVTPGSSAPEISVIFLAVRIIALGQTSLLIFLFLFYFVFNYFLLLFKGILWGSFHTLSSPDN